ncbi:zona pellucida sperm-binding protein 4-like [Seriola lalandi dorsalis]|uniref:zona pellucida sperm-binding protein 4-like n=1 Tax=Seriola lalandi dorsalis TaxID=1841481 RepID=UPI000C6FBCEA|nr:zona pellucida sperm-binding protein 4-like [Seriola lalandi dorsalis]
MEKRWSATSLVALALLGSFVGTNVEAQGSMWQNAGAKGAPPPQAPKAVPRPQVPQVSPPSPQFPHYPKIQPPPPQKVPQYFDVPQIQPPPPQKVPQYSHEPQIQPPPPQKVPQYSDMPQIQPPPPQKVPQYSHEPQIQPPPPQKVPQYSDVPQIQPPTPQRVPQYSHVPQIQPPPPQRVPQYSHVPQIQPPPPQKVPQYSHVPKVQPPPPQKQPIFQSCEVAPNVRVPCGGPDISAAACEAISCCFDGRQCYFGKAVTVQCTKDAQFIVVVARDATLPHIDLESVALLGGGQGCTHVDSNSDFAIYQFPVTACGSVIMEEPGVIIYENRMSSSYEVGIGDRGAITRDSYYELLFQCRYIGTSVETVVVEVLPLQDPPLPAAALGPIQVHLWLANGQCHTKGCNELDVAYNSFYTDADYPVTKVLRDPVYVEVQLLDKTDPNLVLTLGRCWTTTSSNPHSLPQWDILIDG